MLDLHDPLWSELKDALGPATESAALLGRLSTVPPDDDEYANWDEIWGRLCRQDAIYTASFAAVPWIVRLAQARPPAGRTMYLAFIGRVETLRRLLGTPAPKVLEGDYVEALTLARDLTLATLRNPFDVENFRYLTGVLAVVSGHALFGAFLQDLDGVECPECKAIVDLRSPG